LGGSGPADPNEPATRPAAPPAPGTSARPALAVPPGGRPAPSSGGPRRPGAVRSVGRRRPRRGHDASRGHSPAPAAGSCRRPRPVWPPVISSLRSTTPQPRRTEIPCPWPVGLC